MAYVDRAFSISDEGITMDGAYVVHHRPPVKEIALAVGLLVLGALGVVLGIIMAANEVGGDRTHGVLFAILGSMLFIPGFYYTRIAYYAYKGYKGFSFSNIPPEEECNVSLSLAIGGVGDLPFIKNLDQTSFKEEKEEKRDGGGTRKKLRLSGEQLALLEDSFRAHSTLAPDQKQELAQRLHLQPRQVEVWFQNRRARTKLKQTEVDCGFLRRCCERLANENRRLKRELMEMRSVVKPGPQLSIEHRKAARLRMCSSCEKMTSDEKESSLLSTINS